MIWIFHFTVTTILLLITIKTKKEEFFIKSSFFYALFIFGQRWMTGTDFPNYLKYTLIDFSVQEPIYNGLQQLLMKYNLYFGILIFVIFFIILYNNYRFIIKIDRNVVIMLYLYLFAEIFFAQMSQLRQFVAISFFINSYYYSFNKKYFKSGLNILLALGFHTSAIFMIPVLFIRLNLNRIKMLYLLLLSSVLPLLDISRIVELPIFSRYSHYLTGIHNRDLSIFHYFKYYVLLIILFTFVWYIREYKFKPIDQMILTGLILNIILYGFSFQIGLMIRLSFYFKIFELVFIAYYYKELHQFSIKILQPLVLTFFVGIYLGLGWTDPYNITRYEFRPLRVHEERSMQQLHYEINTFYD